MSQTSLSPPKSGRTDTAPPTEIVWRPQPGPQKALIDCPLPEVFYGGARGGGKTDGVLGKYALKAKRYGSHFNAVFFRRELPMLDDAIERSMEIYGPLGAKWLDQKKTWRFPWGGRLRFRPLERVEDAEKYQGQNLTDACVEEAGQYPDSRPIDRVNGVLRSAHGGPTQLLLTGNPGGPGQGWIKQRYIDPAPLGMKVLSRKLPNGKEHRFVFIPSRVENNRILMQSDPDYINRLYLVGSPELVNAWLKGDWDAIEGAYFPEFSTSKHVVRPMKLPAHWTRFRAMDWGSAKPFSVGWYAVSDGELPQFPRGALIKYREWYGMKVGQPNVGLKLEAEAVGAGIKERETPEERIQMGVLDPSAFAEDGGPSIASRLGVPFRPADNKRVAEAGAMGGWDQLRARLVGTAEREEETGRVMWEKGGQPMLFFFSTCVHTIRTLPALQHDDSRPEDVDTDAEDHAPDETRYACMSRPWITNKPGGSAKQADYDREERDDEESWKVA
jgi:hypothetical protein